MFFPKFEHHDPELVGDIIDIALEATDEIHDEVYGIDETYDEYLEEDGPLDDVYTSNEIGASFAG